VRNRRLPTAHDTPPDARVALMVTLRTPHGALDVVNTHLSWHPPEGPLRLTQLGMVIDEFSVNEWTTSDARAVLMGDFNAGEDEPCIHLARQKLKDCFRTAHPSEPGYTWLRSNPLNRKWKNMPDRRLDYIFCPQDVRIRRAVVVFNRKDGVGYASDHFAVLADLEWPRKRTRKTRPRA
jgi:endonuclease/exonuclease/phosphatase family metal-dependent hydrolase